MFKIKSKFEEPFDHLSRFELILRLGLYFLVAGILASFILYLFFLYQRFYLTLTQAEEIIILKSQMAVNDLNIVLFKNIEQREGDLVKQAKINWAKVYNHFEQK